MEPFLPVVPLSKMVITGTAGKSRNGPWRGKTRPANRDRSEKAFPMAVPTRIPCTAVPVPPAPAGATGTGARTPGAAADPVRTAPARDLPPAVGNTPVARAVPAGFIWD